MVAAVTQPIKIAISDTAVSLLHWAVTRSPVRTIRSPNTRLLVAAACAGLNSIISLCDHVCIRRSRNASYRCAALARDHSTAAVSPTSRVLMLILVTYHFGVLRQGFIPGGRHSHVRLVVDGDDIFLVFFCRRCVALPETTP
jgi:hypothetical protein